MSRAHAFLLEGRFNVLGIPCDIAFIPREIMIDVCNMGLRFDEAVLGEAIAIIRRCGLPGCKVYRETLYPDKCVYQELKI